MMRESMIGIRLCLLDDDYRARLLLRVGNMCTMAEAQGWRMEGRSNEAHVEGKKEPRLKSVIYVLVPKGIQHQWNT
jgi:hypothetical protein